MQDTSEKLVKVGTAAIYTWPGGSHFVFESSEGLKIKLNVRHTPFGEGLSHAACSCEFM